MQFSNLWSKNEKLIFARKFGIFLFSCPCSAMHIFLSIHLCWDGLYTFFIYISMNLSKLFFHTEDWLLRCGEDKMMNIFSFVFISPYILTCVLFSVKCPYRKILNTCLLKTFIFPRVTCCERNGIDLVINI